MEIKWNIQYSLYKCFVHAVNCIDLWWCVGFLCSVINEFLGIFSCAKVISASIISGLHFSSAEFFFWFRCITKTHYQCEKRCGERKRERERQKFGHLHLVIAVHWDFGKKYRSSDHFHKCIEIWCVPTLFPIFFFKPQTKIPEKKIIRFLIKIVRRSFFR